MNHSRILRNQLPYRGSFFVHNVQKEQKGHCKSRTPPQVGAASHNYGIKDEHGRREDSVNLFTNPSQSSRSKEHKLAYPQHSCAHNSKGANQLQREMGQGTKSLARVQGRR